jgi:DNA polymerase III sliding clamp (beta) subunit (PCNA family)
MEAAEGATAFPVNIEETVNILGEEDLVVHPMFNLLPRGAVCIPSARFFSLLERMKPFMACDDYRPSLNGIYFSHEETQWQNLGLYRAVATDGHTLAAENIDDMAALFIYLNNFIWRPNHHFMRHLKKAAGETVEMRILKNGDQLWVSIRAGEWRVINKVINDPYPPYVKAIEDKRFGAVRFAMRTDVLKVMKKVSDGVVFRHAEPNFLKVTSKSESGTMARVMLPMSESDVAPKQISFTGQFLLNVAAFMETDEIELQGTQDCGYHPFCSTGENRFALVSPRMLPSWAMEE